ncbi:hypothetical protein K443DRAFT_676836 [Laccaria amethystina LaAM-08-1]|uniref:SGF29 C-terminal domain-containing protein n=1 Tax=Laccaria amethystina LaAM-08-1 TaxID=1095629 RepID=A0A0C9Y035_9AGAR|nr:hypothetical protein K443DRAFT_676836 [Laccaria amethystina LaAM-08-1]
MDRRRAISTRPAEEVECWSHAAESLKILSNKFTTSSPSDIVGRVNRLITAWDPDDLVSVQGWEGFKDVYKKLNLGLESIRSSAEEEAKAIDVAMERVGVLIALRNASEAQPQEKRNKRPRALSPSGTPVPTPPAPGSNRTVSITLPARTSSVGPSALVRKRDTKPQPLQERRKVAFHSPPAKGESDENTWILALVTRCINADKNKYEVQDAEPQEDGSPNTLYITSQRNMIPLPDPDAAPGSPSHVSSYPEFPPGSTVMALYPDTSCFYRAEVIQTPKEMQLSSRVSSSKYMPTYKLKFEDDDNQEHSVSAHWVVDWPGN